MPITLDIARLQAALLARVTGDVRYGVFMTDTEFRLVLWNRWMELHTGRTAADALGRPLFEMFPELESRGLRERYDGALIGGVTIVSHGLHR